MPDPHNPNNITLGEAVQLTSGVGPVMVVDEIVQRDDSIIGKCVWHSDNEHREQWYSLTSLQAAP
ncbi:MAG: hypothetical protein JST22_00630 [Bacteroidetes bacterium]|nr:hypothetical protein [Bacteroidota bacterium]